MLLTENEKREIVREQFNEYWDELPDELTEQEKVDMLIVDYVQPASDGQISPSMADRIISNLAYEREQ